MDHRDVPAVQVWNEACEACAGLGAGPPPGRPACTPAESDTAVACLGTPLCARPLSPAAEYVLSIADSPADAGLAFSRARAQDPSGYALLQPYWPGPVTGLWCERGAGPEAFRIRYEGKHALVPMEYARLGSTPHEALARHVLDRIGIDSPLVLHFGDYAGGPALLHAYSALVPLPLLNTPSPVLRYLAAPTGIVQAITGLDAARSIAGVHSIQMRARPGDTIRHVTSIEARDAIGYVLAEDTASARAACAEIVFEATPFC